MTATNGQGIFSQRILSQDALRQTLTPLKATGLKVVFTNGVFDLVHPGHVRYLQAARALGDVLVVALNSDASVRRLKGDKRPVINEFERSKIMASLECVDFVTSFDEDTPLNIIVKLMPDILVKGGDYTPDTIVGRNEVEANGGQCLNLQLVNGVSSTNLIDRILKAQTLSQTATKNSQ